MRSQRVVGSALVVVGALLAITGAALARDPEPGPTPVYGRIPATQPTASPGGSIKSKPSPKTTKPRPQQPVGGRVSPAADRLPLRVDVASVWVAAPVVPVGVRTDGSLVLPAPDQVGWWIGGAQPGDAAGTVVLAGHVDAEDGSHGALYPLTSVRAGDTVRLVSTAGRTTYRVVAMRSYPKRQLPTEVFDQRGGHRLVLITCGGRFVPGRGYTRNVVAYAEPVRP